MVDYPRIVVASGNRKKSEEIFTLLSSSNTPTQLRTNDIADLSAYPDIPPIAETGDTFAENAMQKASKVSRFLMEKKKMRGVLVLADDSGIEVDALGKRPGIWSARFVPRAIEEGLLDRSYREKYNVDADETNIDAMLDLLGGIEADKRDARYVCEIALALDGDILTVCHGKCEGIITDKRYGSGGFGYDPIFFYPPFNMTFGQVDIEKKHTVSHRYCALREVQPFIMRILQDISPRRINGTH
jgi:XTP/dITP diphosphohydrolase